MLSCKDLCVGSVTIDIKEESYLFLKSSGKFDKLKKRDSLRNVKLSLLYLFNLSIS